MFLFTFTNLRPIFQVSIDLFLKDKRYQLYSNKTSIYCHTCRLVFSLNIDCTCVCVCVCTSSCFYSHQLDSDSYTYTEVNTIDSFSHHTSVLRSNIDNRCICIPARERETHVRTCQMNHDKSNRC